MSTIKNEYTLTVDLKKPTTNIRPRFIQYDTAILYFKVYDNGKDFNFSEQTEIQVAHRKKSGRTEVGRAIVVTGKDGKPLIKYEYMGSEMDEEGNVTTSVSILSGTKKVTVQPFVVEMVKDLHSGVVDNVNKEYSLLQQLITTVENAVQGALDSAKLVKDAVDNANTAVNEINTKLPLLDDVISQEETRNTNETKRIADEKIRISNESTRISTENKRVSDETTRKNSETSRVTSETQRTTSESKRVNAENIRVTNEDARKVDELSRVSEEAIRVNNENKRNTAENQRESNETARSSSELDRILKENERDGEELKRVITESQRVTQEQSRVNAENQRVTDELTRQSNEQHRIDNESERTSTFNTKIEEVNKVVTDGNEMIASTAHKGAYSPTTYYYKNNYVQYNGSTWRCLIDSINIAPKEGVNWTLVAQRGIDGSGAVSTVSGVHPDESGNIEISVTNVNGLQESLDELQTFIKKESFVSTAGQTVFTLTQGTYLINENRIEVEVGGVPQFSPNNFTETSEKTIAFKAPLEAGLDVVITYYSDFLPIRTDVEGRLVTIETDLNSVSSQITNKVDKVTGKGLSTNDYTTAEKTKLNGIESGAQVNKVTSVNGQIGDVTVQGFSGSYNDLTNKPNSFTPSTHSHPISQVTGLQVELDKKYVKPTNGIPSTDLDLAVKSSLNKADTALQNVPDASTTTKGVVQLNDTLTSTSTTLASTANQAKVLKDLVDTHTNLKNNPHNVTKAQVGLGNVDNTSDLDKPVSTAQQAEISSVYRYVHEVDGIVLSHIEDEYTPFKQSTETNISNLRTETSNQIDILSQSIPTKASQIAIDDASNLFTSTEIEGALSELFTNVSNGKSTIATAITDKGVLTSSSDTFATMATNISQIQSGTDTSDATAIAGDILSGKTAYANGSKLTGALALSGTASTSNVLTGQTFYSTDAKTKLTGTMANNGSIGTITPSTSAKSYSAGYYNTFSVAGDSDLVAGNIKSGVNLFGVTGNLNEGYEVYSATGINSNLSLSSGTTSFSVTFSGLGFTPTSNDLIIISVPSLSTNYGSNTWGGTHRRGFVNTIQSGNASFNVSSYSYGSLTASFYLSGFSLTSQTWSSNQGQIIIIRGVGFL